MNGKTEKTSTGKGRRLKVDWKSIRNEYVIGEISQDALADKHGLSRATVRNKAYAERWGDTREQYRRKVEEKTIQKMEDVAEAEAASKLQTQVWVKSKLREIVERCLQGEPVYDKQGNMTGEWKFESASAIRALELLGKDAEMFRNEAAGTRNNSTTLLDALKGSSVTVNVSLPSPKERVETIDAEYKALPAGHSDD